MADALIRSVKQPARVQDSLQKPVSQQTRKAHQKKKNPKKKTPKRIIDTYA